MLGHWAMNKDSLRRRMIAHWGLATVVVMACAPLVVPASAEAAGTCAAWTTEMQDDEGGPVLTAHTCSDDALGAYLSLRCFDGKVVLENDLGAGTDIAVDPMQELIVPVELVADEGEAEISLQFSQMTATFIGETPASGSLVGLLRSGTSVEIRDPAGVYPARTYPLAGSSKAIRTLLEGCR